MKSEVTKIIREIPKTQAKAAVREGIVPEVAGRN